MPRIAYVFFLLFIIFTQISKIYDKIRLNWPVDIVSTLMHCYIFLIVFVASIKHIDGDVTSCWWSQIMIVLARTRHRREEPFLMAKEAY